MKTTRIGQRQWYRSASGRPRQSPFSSQSRERAIDRGEHRSDGADAAAADEIEFDAGFVEGAQDARVIRAVGAGAGQDQRGAPLR